jgi:hypothetical protein
MRGQNNWHPHLYPVEGEEGRGVVRDIDAGAAGQTVLSGSQIKPPALPEVHDICTVMQIQILVETIEPVSCTHN